MKTQKINFKKLALTAGAALFIASGSFTQSDVEYQSNDMVSLVNLETLMSLTEDALRYTAPALPESEAYYAEFERMDVLADATKASLKYEAPEVNDVTAEVERMDVLSAATEASVKYQAPEVNDLTAEVERLDILAAVTEASLRYSAPEAIEVVNDASDVTLFANNAK